MNADVDLFDVRCRVALVTGAASGLGLAIATILAERGALVCLADVDAQGLERAGSLLERLGRKTETVVLDVGDRNAVTSTVAALAQRHGRLDIAFANAGISAGPGFGASPEEGGIQNVAADGWDRVLGTNLTGAFATVQAAAAHMKRQRSGTIVVTASSAGIRADPAVGYAYAASKAAVINLVRQAAVEMAAFNVRVNAIAPGPFTTNIAGGRPMDPQRAELFRSQVPLGRFADPGEIQGLALLLASDAGSYITGATIPIDGGATAH